jgi:hypothetical protein
MWVGIALIGAAIFFIGFEGTDSGRIQWRGDALTLIAGLLSALQGYYRLQKQRNIPPEAGSEDPKTKNQTFLNPWLFAVLSGITLLLVMAFLFPNTPIHIRVLIAILVFSFVNIRFFLLRRKGRIHKSSETGSSWPKIFTDAQMGPLPPARSYWLSSCALPHNWAFDPWTPDALRIHELR